MNFFLGILILPAGAMFPDQNFGQLVQHYPQSSSPMQTLLMGLNSATQGQSMSPIIFRASPNGPVQFDGMSDSQSPLGFPGIPLSMSLPVGRLPSPQTLAVASSGSSLLVCFFEMLSYYMRM